MERVIVLMSDKFHLINEIEWNICCGEEDKTFCVCIEAKMWCLSQPIHGGLTIASATKVNGSLFEIEEKGELNRRTLRRMLFELRFDNLIDSQWITRGNTVRTATERDIFAYQFECNYETAFDLTWNKFLLFLNWKRNENWQLKNVSIVSKRPTRCVETPHTKQSHNDFLSVSNYSKWDYTYASQITLCL